MRYNGLLFLIVITVLLFSCREQTNKEYSRLIVGNWQLYNFSTNQKITNQEEYKRMSRQIILSTSLIIRPDGRIKSVIWGTSSNGYWQVRGDELIVYDKRRRTKFSAKILKLNEEQLLLYQQVGKVKVVLYFRRFD